MDFDEMEEPKEKIRRKGKKPTRFKPDETTSRSVKTLATEKNKGKKISLETDSDVQKKKKNTSGEKVLVIKEPVLESTSHPVKTLETESKRNGKRICLESDSDVRPKKKKTTEEKHLFLKEPVPENLPITPQLKSDQFNDLQDKRESKKKPTSSGFGLVDCVKILRQLESSDHIDKDFRQKFLTWYSLKARPEETRVARTFLHAFKDDSEALAEQLIDAFSEFILKKPSATGDGDGASSSGALFKKPRINY